MDDFDSTSVLRMTVAGCAACPFANHTYGTETLCDHPDAPATDNSVSDGFGRVLFDAPNWCSLDKTPVLVRLSRS